ncbi:hypothetical protein IEO21_10271 [Rhodonia placenta]|uniref:CAP-Gly domain-containing protein n=1 Tax=Rhodonia placenta TaxID=104341 RepID=A0A8H7NST3_9APHY|nr:hypothetical protein IEO21_10271 [Postia placenta]
MAPAEPPLGALVEVPAGRGLVRFCGGTSFSAGRWVGIELSEANGKNDGTVQGIKYFTGKPNHAHQTTQPSTLRRVSEPLRDPEPEPEPEPSSPIAPQEPSRPSTPVRAQDDQEVQELRAKIRVLEAKRADDARHVRELETRLSEAESFVALRPKLQAKLSSQQTELITTRRELADAQQLAQMAESRIVDMQEQLEMATLDKEMAEERAEMAEAELEEVKENLAIVEVELQVLKEGGERAEEVTETPVKQSLAYIQLEKQNERLKEALIRRSKSMRYRCQRDLGRSSGAAREEQYREENGVAPDVGPKSIGGPATGRLNEVRWSAALG